MKLKGCLLGDSHIAKLILALRENDNPLADTHFDVVAGHGPAISVMEIVSGVFTPTNQRGRQIFEKLGDNQPGKIQDYDYFIITGSGIGLGTVIAALRDADLWFPQHRGKATLRSRILGKRKSRPLISRACLKAAIRAHLDSSAMIRFARTISAETNAHIFIMPQPRPSDRLMKVESRRVMPIYRRVARSSVVEEADEIYTRTVQEFMAEIPSVTFVLQDPETITHVICTDDKYMSDAARLTNLKTKHNQRDHIHANTLYGKRELLRVRAARDKLNLFADSRLS